MKVTHRTDGPNGVSDYMIAQLHRAAIIGKVHHDKLMAAGAIFDGMDGYEMPPGSAIGEGVRLWKASVKEVEDLEASDREKKLVRALEAVCGAAKKLDPFNLEGSVVFQGAKMGSCEATEKALSLAVEMAEKLLATGGSNVEE